LQRRRISVIPLSKESMDREPYGIFDGWLENLERAISRNMRILLCLDEYENLQRNLDSGWGDDFLNLLRHILQHRRSVALLFTGSHTLEQQGPAWTNRFLNARRIRVSFLKDEEVIPLLTEPIPAFDMSYGDDALKLFLLKTHGQPFLTQAVAFELVE